MLQNSPPDLGATLFGIPPASVYLIKATDGSFTRNRGVPVAARADFGMCSYRARARVSRCPYS